MSQKCLLIRTKDGRDFLTYYKNLPCVIEFVKTFHAEVFKTTALKNQKVMELKSLTTAICDPQYKGQVQCGKISRLYPSPSKGRKNIIKEAQTIRSYISKSLMSGDTVSLKELKKKYQKLELTDACLCNHMAVVRKELSKSGCLIRKIGAGMYCLSPQE